MSTPLRVVAFVTALVAAFGVALGRGPARRADRRTEPVAHEGDGRTRRRGRPRRDDDADRPAAAG